MPDWRRIQADEYFIYGYEDKGPNRGYVVESYVLLNNHETCSCMLSKTPVKIKWFMPHSLEWHGEYPVHHSKLNELLQQLVDEKPWTNIGACLQLFPHVSYGNLLKK